MTTTDSLLALLGVEFQRGDFSLRIDELDLLKGQIYLLEGPNGCGKSTLLQLLATLLVPSKGTFSFDGHTVAGESQRQLLRRHITLVDQSPYLFDTSIFQNLAFGLRLRNVPGPIMKQRIDQALDLVGMAGAEKRHALTLSGGESRRVSLARAMVLEPQVLLLDEPNVGLDRDILPVFETCLETLSEQGATVVIASHDGDQSRRLSGRILTLDRGRLLPVT
jgi:tungstate transport system ATP-binding protein